MVLLQRLRDQIKTWLNTNEIRDKAPLQENRKKIENVGTNRIVDLSELLIVISYLSSYETSIVSHLANTL